MDDGRGPPRDLAAANELLRIAPGFFGLVDAGGRILDLNDRVLAAIDVPRERFIGELLWKGPGWAPLPAAAAKARNAFERALAGETVELDLEYWAGSPGGPGQVRWLAMCFTPTSGQRVAVTGVDITDRVRDAQEVAASEARYREAKSQLDLALQNAAMGTFRVEVAARRLTTSATTAALFGRSAIDEDVFDAMFEIVHPDDRDRVNRLWQAAVATQAPYYDEYRIVRPDGEVRWMSSRGTTTVDKRGVPQVFSGVIADITHRKEAERRLAFERTKLAAIFRESPAGMSLWRGRDLVFEMVNPAYQAIFGSRPLLGRRLLDALPELKDQPFADLMRRVLETGETFHGTEVLARLARDDGPVEDRYYDFSYVRIDDEHGNPYGVYDHAIDVTDRVVEREMREHMVAALTHDLRTPLQNARLAAEMMLGRVAAGTKDHHLATRIIANVDRADRMIRDLLDASRLRAGQPIPLVITDGDASEVARSTLDAMGASRFTLRAPPSVPGRWDLGALQRILENLAGNAVKYGAHGTPITVDVEPDGDVLHLRVHNHGNPIPSADLAGLFNLFKRSAGADGRVHGWGVGLSVVRGLAVAHGGDVTVQSSAAEGTTFTVTLPLRA